MTHRPTRSLRFVNDRTIQHSGRSITTLGSEVRRRPVVRSVRSVHDIESTKVDDHSELESIEPVEEGLKPFVKLESHFCLGVWNKSMLEQDADEIQHEGAEHRHKAEGYTDPDPSRHA